MAITKKNMSVEPLARSLLFAVKEKDNQIAILANI